MRAGFLEIWRIVEMYVLHTAWHVRSNCTYSVDARFDAYVISQSQIETHRWIQRRRIRCYLYYYLFQPF